MRQRHYHKEANGRRSRKYASLERSRKAQAPSQPMPALPGPFVAYGDCHYTLIHDEVTCTLFYDRQCEIWSVRFDWPGIFVGWANQFDRDTLALEMQAKIIAAINARWGDDWMTENLPTGDTLGQDDAPARYCIGRGEY